jgi:hypothetical protein
MARARNIKPGLFKNEILGVADPLYTLLFEGLWILADRAGRLEDRPVRIKGELFPYRDGLDIESMLGWLVDSGFIRRYTVGGKRYILICEFVKHQNPHKNEAESVIPAPEEIGSEPEFIGSTLADPLSTDSLIPDSLPSGEPPAEDTPTEAKKAQSKPREPKEPSATGAVWEAYRSSYCERYGVDPVRNAQVNGQLAQVVAKLGAGEAPSVAAHYLGHRDAFYVKSGHSVGMLLRDAEKLRMEWATGRRIAAPSSGPPQEPAWRTEQRQRTQLAAPGVAVQDAQDFFIDAEVKRVTADHVGRSNLRQTDPDLRPVLPSSVD